MLKDGDKAPDFALPRDGGETVKLSQFEGKLVVLFFYPQDDTPGCTSEAVGFSARLDEFHRAGAEMIGISPDSVKSHEKFRDKHGLTVMLLADQDRQAIEAYGLWGEKSMFGRTFMGVERATFIIGKNGEIFRSWRKVKVPGHVDKVLAAVREM